MKLPKDSRLAVLADQVGTQVTFDDPDGAVRHQLVRIHNSGKQSQGVSRVGNYYVVRVTICGIQQTIARFPSNQIVAAARFADLALHHFWKYRKTNRPCDDSDLTLGSAILSQAPMNALMFLDMIEEHLKSTGAIVEDFKSPAGSSTDPIVAHLDLQRAWKKYRKALALLRKLITPSGTGVSLWAMIDEETESYERTINGIKI